MSTAEGTSQTLACIILKAFRVVSRAGDQQVGATSGYAIAVVSQSNVIFNNAGQDAKIVAAIAGRTLNLCSFYGTPGYSQASPLSFRSIRCANSCKLIQRAPTGQWSLCQASCASGILRQAAAPPSCTSAQPLGPLFTHCPNASLYAHLALPHLPEQLQYPFAVHSVYDLGIVESNMTYLGCAC